MAANCRDCGLSLPYDDEVETADVCGYVWRAPSNWAPMLKGHLWQSITSDRQDVVCFVCCERRLGRRIERRDLLACEMNNLENWVGHDDLYVTHEELCAPLEDTWVD
jgi:hypothetical protein